MEKRDRTLYRGSGESERIWERQPAETVKKKRRLDDS